MKNLAIDNIVKNMGGEAFSYKDDSGNKKLKGVQLIDKKIGVPYD